MSEVLFTKLNLTQNPVLQEGEEMIDYGYGITGELELMEKLTLLPKDELGELIQFQVTMFSGGNHHLGGGSTDLTIRRLLELNSKISGNFGVFAGNILSAIES